jgi:hypothetical protein
VKNPDRYAAAICIRVRPDRGILSARSASVRAAKGITDLRRYPDVMSFSLNVYFFFLFDVFFAVFFAAFTIFFAFFAFLAIVPSVTPKLAQCKSTSTCIPSDYAITAKIDTARLEEGKRPAHPRDLRLGSRVMRRHIAPCWIKRRRRSHVVGRRSRRWEA